MSGIWIKLYIGQSDPIPTTLKVKPESGSDIDDLKTKIKEAKPNDLTNCDAFRLDVYPRGTSVPISTQVQPIDPGAPVPRCSDPLIVIAPENPQQQHGEFCCSFCFALCCAILYASVVVRTRIDIMAATCSNASSIASRPPLESMYADFVGESTQPFACVDHPSFKQVDAFNQQQAGEFCCSFFVLRIKFCAIQYASFVIHTSSECGGSNSGVWILKTKNRTTHQDFIVHPHIFVKMVIPICCCHQYDVLLYEFI